MISRVVPGKGTHFEKFRRNFNRINGSGYITDDEDIQNHYDFINKEYGVEDDDDYAGDEYFDAKYDDFLQFCEWQERRKAVRKYSDDVSFDNQLHVQSLGNQSRSETVLCPRGDETSRFTESDGHTIRE